MRNMSKEKRLIELERRKVNFNIEELTNVWDGGKTETQLRRKVEKVFTDDPVLRGPPVTTMTREERFTEATRKSVHVFKNIVQQQGWHPLSPEINHIPRGMPLDYNLIIHTGAFIPSLMSFGSPEQVSKWLPLSANLNIIGTYAQTELGHGTFLRGLEMTADYNHETEEFVLNCPTITAMKWWPGDLGKNANHAMVMANLRIKGVKYGMHPFIVQIRDLSTHQPMPGVVVGDIGNKFGFQSVDNGFLYLKNVRIPRENLLCKNAEVQADGSYVKKVSDRMMYGSMVNLRVNLPKSQAIDPLAKACTIAVRYSTVRQQGLINPNGSEVAVMDYVTQQHKLLPQIAVVYATNFAGEQIKLKYKNFLKNADKGDLSELAELHALAASFKASAAEQGTEGVEICRRACGGHGYSHASGLPDLLARVTPSCTYEGENTVLYLQTARYLVKCANQPRNLDETVSFLNSREGNIRGNLLSLDNLVRCFQLRASTMIKTTAQKMSGLLSRGTTQENAWNACSVQLVNIAKAYVIQYILTSYVRHIAELRCSAPVRNILEDLARLYGVHLVNKHAGDFLKAGVLTAEQCDEAFDAEMKLLANLRPNAVGIVDAFDFSDQSLGSCLGVYDGDVYEALFRHAKEHSPLNKSEAGVLTAEQCDEAFDAEMKLLANLRPNAVGIVDAFDFSDQSLGSCLGVYDGDVYEALFRHAKEHSPLNKSEVHQASYQYLRPHLLEGRDILEGVKSKL